MEAFPRVLEKIPNARLLVAGANHHTKAGYWESIRAAQPPHLPIEFLGYVPEEDIPDLYQRTSVVVMPYDSATGSSGPAHQACEYGVPIVCADLADFRGMAADENMAILFHNVGDAAELADRLIAILQSTELEHQMAERNFAAGVEMTMANVVANYLRWFQLKKTQNAVSKTGGLLRRRRSSLDISRRSDRSSGSDASASLFSDEGVGTGGSLDLEPASEYAGMTDYGAQFSERSPSGRDPR